MSQSDDAVIDSAVDDLEVAAALIRSARRALEGAADVRTLPEFRESLNKIASLAEHAAAAVRGLLS